MGAFASKPKASASSSSAAAPPTAAPPVVVGEVIGSATPVPKPEPVLKADENVDGCRPQLDLVFTLDCTGSMGSYIQSAKKNIETIVAKLEQSEGYDLRFALVAYRDHPPQDQTYVTKPFAFTSDLSQMKSNLGTLSAQGGGDGPEAVGAALKATLEQDWRERATKVAILIADAPPHGLGESGDGFPNGAPDGVDPFAMLDALAMRGISIYSVGCEPAIGNFRYAKDFLIAAAQKTNGQAVSLGSAAALADVIMGGAIEEMDLEQLVAAELVQEVRALRAARPEMDDEECKERAWSSIAARGHQTRHMETRKLKSKNAELVCRATSLAAAREGLASAAPPSPKAQSAKTARCKARGASLARRASPVRTLEKRRESVDVMETEDCDSWSSDEGEAMAAPEGVRLETRALSFTQMSRVYGRQKAMGLY